MVDLLDSSENIKTIYLVRHGETLATRKGTICGQSDVALNQEGIEQAEVIGAWFGDIGVESIFASPLSRTVQTADIIAKYAQLTTYYKHSGLVEKKEGEWEGKTYWQVREESPKLWEKWSNDPINFAPPGGESVKDFVARVGRALNDIIKNYATGNKIVLVTHAGVIRSVMMNSLDIPVENFFRIDVPVASVSRIDWSESFCTLKYSGLILESYSYSVA
jgi:broad specificity phosphatase PhoE